MSLGLYLLCGALFAEDKQHNLAEIVADKLSVTIYAQEMKKVANYQTRVRLRQTYKNEQRPRRFGKNVNLHLNFGQTAGGSQGFRGKPKFGQRSQNRPNFRKNTPGQEKGKKRRWNDGKPICDSCGRTGHIKKDCRSKKQKGGEGQRKGDNSFGRKE